MNEKETPIDDLDGDILMDDDKKSETQAASSNPWDDEEVEKDEFSDRDPEQTRELYTLSIPNNEKLEDGSDNPGHYKLCMDQKQTIPPVDSFKCIILARLRPKITQVPYNESKGLPAYEKMIGYSYDGIIPTPDSEGNYMPQCVGNDGVPFACCSQPVEWEDGEPIPTPLNDAARVVTPKDFSYLPKGTKIDTKGECPWARWGNTMTNEDLKRFNLRSTSKPECVEYVILLGWRPDIQVYFKSYWKIKSKPSVDAFIASFRRANHEDPLRRFVAEITVKKESTYAIPQIRNTGEEADYAQVKPVWDYFNENKQKFVRNESLTMEELRKEAAKAEDLQKPEE